LFSRPKKVSNVPLNSGESRNPETKKNWTPAFAGVTDFLQLPVHPWPLDPCLRTPTGIFEEGFSLGNLTPPEGMVESDAEEGRLACYQQERVRD
jgi:hypothetical protein